ncbi:hypothetical protein LPJ61_001978 [Coemansia biformis]|uniref:Uncharacterized protein n=1 Tax=Coemansia biformis TaxID=1286918 RepID=A0A9W7Y940_9FUNG|nr:hypothetical protein LPJ61_001978 [Coemansia biformis]
MSASVVCAPRRSIVLTHRIETLQQANELLTQPNICLSRIRMTLAHLGVYWSVDKDTIFKISTGVPNTAIQGIEQMRSFFITLRSTAGLEKGMDRDVAVFLDRSRAWIQTNRIPDTPAISAGLLPATLTSIDMLMLAPADIT